MWLTSSTWAVPQIRGYRPLTLTASEVNFTEWDFRFIAIAINSDTAWPSALGQSVALEKHCIEVKEFVGKNVILNLPWYSN